MNKTLTALAVSTVTAWAVGYSAMASAQVEASVYGRVVAGAFFTDSDEGADSSAWDLGATGHDGSDPYGSRIGFKGEADLGNGLTAGFQIERGVGSDATSGRHNNLYLSGGFGTITMGQQGTSYNSARKWDQTNFFGGGDAYTPASRDEGIKYAMSAGGFNFDVMAMANGEADGDADDDSGVDRWIVHAGYNFGPVNLDVAIATDVPIGVDAGDAATFTVDGNGDVILDDAAEADEGKVRDGTNDTHTRDNMAIGINGTAGPVDWYLAYQTSERTDDVNSDIDGIGGFLGFNMSESDILYAYYVTHDYDVDNNDNDNTFTETIFGYSRDIGPGVKFIAEYQESDQDVEDESPSKLALAVKVDF